MLTLGIDIGGSSVKLGAIRDGQAIWVRQSRVYAQPPTEELIETIRSSIQGEAHDCDAVGICVPGLLDASARKVTLSVNMPGLEGVVLDDLVARALGRRVRDLRIVNDAVAAATDVILAHRLGGRVMAIALGTGVGMGVLDEGGKPLVVEGASPGHIGQIDVSIDDEQDGIPIGPDGGAGSLEAYLGVPALLKRFGSMDRFFQTASGQDVPIRALARAIRICHAIYRPHHVVLLGGVGVRLKHLVPDLRDLISKNLTSVARPDWTLSTGNDDFHAARGAARLAGSQ